MAKDRLHQFLASPDAAANPSEALRAILLDKYSSDRSMGRMVGTLLTVFVCLLLPAVAGLLLSTELQDVPVLSQLSHNAFLPHVTVVLASITTLFLGKAWQLRHDRHRVLGALTLLLAGDLRQAAELGLGGKEKGGKAKDVISAVFGAVTPG